MPILVLGPNHRTAPIEVREAVAFSPEAQRSRSVVPLIRRMRSSADHDSEIELARARKRLARGDDPMQVLEALGIGLTNKLLHAPMRALNQAQPEARESLVRSFKALYLRHP